MSNQDPKIKVKKEVLIGLLNKIVYGCVRVLAVLMIVVIVASVADVVFIIYNKIFIIRPLGYFHIEEILNVLGAFIGVLIAIEIFNNVIIYLEKDSLHVRLVLATALIAVSRKVIILDYQTVEPTYLYGIGALVLATALAYCMITYSHRKG